VSTPRVVEILPLDGGAPQTYELGEQLGQGAMGSVHRAYDPALGRWVALKVLEGDGHEARWKRFLREAQTVAALTHPGLVPLHGAGLLNGRPCLVLGLVDQARTLDQAWRGAALAVRLDLLQQICGAMGAAHAGGVVHRDLKPDNVLVDGAGQAFVTDFGVALVVGSERMTRTGAVVGTIATMAPEQIAGRRDQVGPASDVWALGVLLYLALTERLPFAGATMHETMARIAQSAKEAPRALDPTLPPALEAVCLRCLEPDPAQRYPDASALGEALRLARAAPSSRPRAPILVGVILVVGLALTLAALSLQENPGPPLSPSVPERQNSVTPGASPPSPDGPSRRPRLVRDHELDLGTTEWRTMAATQDAIWVAEGSGVLRFQRQGRGFAPPAKTSLEGHVWDVAAVGDRIWVVHGEQGVGGAAKNLPVGIAWISELSADSPPRRIWSGKGNFRRYGWLGAWPTPEGGTRLLLCANGVTLITLDAEGALLGQQPLECPVNWIRGLTHLPQRGQFALCGNGSGRLEAFVGVYDDQTGSLVWSTDFFAETTIGIAEAPEGALFVGLRDRRRVVRVERSRAPKGPFAELEAPTPRDFVKRLLARRGWLYSVAAGRRNSELEVVNATTGHRVQRVASLAKCTRLYWDAPGERLWVVSLLGVESWRDAQRED
jgi:serine/threonine protein kinase